MVRNDKELEIISCVKKYPGVLMCYVIILVLNNRVYKKWLQVTQLQITKKIESNKG